MAPVWKIVEKGMHHETDESTKNEIRQIYSSVAELYHRYRPKYPESFIDDAIERSPLLLSKTMDKKEHTAHILEIGCGPGTITYPLGSRGYQITAIDPGMGMIKKAQEVCQDLPNVQFQTVPFKLFQSDENHDNDNDNNNMKQYDAIVAATSLHWALTEGDRDKMIHKLESLLKDDGTLILFWNYPALPSSTSLLDKIADALGEPKPFCFGVESIDALHSKMEQHVHTPILESNLFESSFWTKEVKLEEKTPITDFLYLMQTTSTYITMELQEKERVFAIIEDIMRRECGEFIDTNRKIILNVTTKKKK